MRFAGETVRDLSDGDPGIELDHAEDGPDRAFTLQVRRADDSTPLGAHHLSGSQKFRWRWRSYWGPGGSPRPAYRPGHWKV